MKRHIPEAAITQMLEREAASFSARNPISKQLAEDASKNWLCGVPLHWMADWDMPFPLFIDRAQGVDVTDVDGHHYIDFCLGDTGAMFGHAPPPVVATLQAEAAQGLTAMLPARNAAKVGHLLQERFHLPTWQVTTTASDANRALLRWCRAITGRQKILVFNHSYHGAVDETFVTCDGGTIHNDPSLVGEPRDLSSLTKVVEFNDVAALKAALEPRDVACVLAEPIMTNVGMVLPDDGFLQALRDLTTATGTLLVIDETHCLSSGPGGYSGEHGLQPDALVMGKPIAGGIPAAVYGVSQDVSERIKSCLQNRTPGHSGIGTTLSGSRIQLALIETMLETYFTREAYAPLIALAKKLEKGLSDTIIKHDVTWHVVRAGARVEFMCAPTPPRNGGEAAQIIHQPVDQAIHHYLLNRGVLMTPFHNMMLVCPATTGAHVNQLVHTLDQCLTELLS